MHCVYLELRTRYVVPAVELDILMLLYRYSCITFRFLVHGYVYINCAL